MKQYILALFALLMIVALLAACGTAKSTRKCDGRKGQKTPMGLL